MSERRLSPLFEEAQPVAEMLRLLGYEPEKDNPRIRFKSGLFADIELILVGGAITTQDRYEAFTDSLAHLCDDGRVMRYGEQIGTKDDIEFLPAAVQP